MAWFRKTGKAKRKGTEKEREKKKRKKNSPTKGRRISSSDRVGGRASALGSGNLIAEDGGEEEGGRLHHVRAAPSLHPHGDAGDGEVLTGAAGITVRFVVLGASSSVGVELVADEEQLLAVAPRRKDVLDHFVWWWWWWWWWRWWCVMRCYLAIV